MIYLGDFKFNYELYRLNKKGIIQNPLKIEEIEIPNLIKFILKNKFLVQLESSRITLKNQIEFDFIFNKNK